MVTPKDAISRSRQVGGIRFFYKYTAWYYIRNEINFCGDTPL